MSSNSGALTREEISFSVLTGKGSKVGGYLHDTVGNALRNCTTSCISSSSMSEAWEFCVKTLSNESVPWALLKLVCTIWCNVSIQKHSCSSLGVSKHQTLKSMVPLELSWSRFLFEHQFWYLRWPWKDDQESMEDP